MSTAPADRLEVTPRPLARNLLGRNLRRWALSAGSVLLLLIIWEIAGISSATAARLVSHPSAVLAAGVRMVLDGELGRNAAVSALEFVLGFVPAVVVGILIGLLMAIVRPFRHLTEPLLIGLYTTPYVTLIPLLIVWFGVGVWSKAAVVFLAAVFPVAINTLAAARQIDRVLVWAVRSLGGQGHHLIRHVVIPSALPGIITGMQLAIGRALVGIIVGEMYVSVAGLGNVLRLYASAGRVAEIFVVVFCFAVVGIGTTLGLSWLEERIGRWRRGR